MKITKATKSDLKKLFDLEHIIFPRDPFAISKSSFRYNIIKNNIINIELEDENGNPELVGYSLWMERKNSFRLYSFGINPKHRGKGLSKILLEDNIKRFGHKKLSLEVKVNNKTAISLYEKYGFKIVKVLKEYYDECDGYYMERSVVP